MPFLLRKHFHFVGSRSESRRADFVSHCFDLRLAVSLRLANRLDQRPEILRILAVEDGVKSGVHRFLIGGFDEFLRDFVQPLLTCQTASA